MRVASILRQGELTLAQLSLGAAGSLLAPAAFLQAPREAVEGLRLEGLAVPQAGFMTVSAGVGPPAAQAAASLIATSPRPSIIPLSSWRPVSQFMPIRLPVMTI